MTIYIEQVIITNFIVDFCIVTIISKIIYSKPNYRLVVLSALFGSIASLIVPYCSNWILLNALKILTAIIMLQIIHLSNKQLLFGTLLMLMSSYIIGGALLSNFGALVNGSYMLSDINLIYIFIISITSTFIISKLINYIKRKITNNANIYDITLIYNSNSIKIKSFIDSGNSLYDNDSPVSLINFDTFSTLTQTTLNQYLTNDFSTLNNPHFITASTIAGKRKILVFTIDELHIKHKIYKSISLGVALNFDNNKEYKAILNSCFCFN